MIYLDNASSSNPKPRSVIKAMKKSLTKLNANPARSGHKLSIDAGLQIYNARTTIQKFFNAKSASDIVFTSGCTEALNLAILGSVKTNGHILTTVYEHNSVYRTLEHLKETHNISYTILYPKTKLEPVLAKQFSDAILPNTYMIITNHTSNVTGTTIDIEQVGIICKKNNLIFLVDGAQSAGHTKIDIQKHNINLLAVAGHKGLLGPQGVGVLVVNNVKIQPIKFGGTGTYSDDIKQPSEMPEAFESGTQATPNILALAEGVKFVEKHQNKINQKITKTTQYLVSQLSSFENIKIYTKNIKTGVVSFEFIDKDNNFIASKLSEKYKIYIRTGIHCAPVVAEYLNKKSGTIRISIGYKNNIRQIKKTISAITSVLKTI